MLSNHESSESLSVLPTTSEDYTIYKKRWAHVAMFSFISFSNAITWITFSSIFYQVTQFYDQSSLAINFLSLVFLICYVPLFLPASWILDIWGLRPGAILIGGIFTSIGAWIRVLGYKPSLFFVLLIGQIICACAQPFILNAQPMVAANWFPAGERTIATTIITASNAVGSAAGIFIPSLIVSNTTCTNETTCSDGKIMGMDQIPFLLFLEAVFCTVWAVIGLIFFSSKPPTPPSAAAEMAGKEVLAFKESVYSSLRQTGELFLDINFLFLTAAFGITMGMFNTLATLLDQIFSPYDYSDVQTGLAGAFVIVAGLVGAGILGTVVDKYRVYKTATLFCLIGGTISLVVFTLLIPLKIYALVSVALMAFGFCNVAYLPISLELSAEITFGKMKEAIPSGIMIATGQIFGIVMIVGLGEILSEKTTKSVQITLWVSAGLTAISILVMAFFRGELKRNDFENLHKEEARPLI